MYPRLVHTKLGAFILIVHLYIIQGSADIYNPFIKLRTGRRLNDNNDVTTLPHVLDENLKFSTSTSKPTIDTSASNRLTHFDSLFNNQSLLSQSLNRPRIRSTSTQPNELNSKLRSSSDELAILEKRQNAPYLDNNVYNELLQILAGSLSNNLKANRSPINIFNNNQQSAANNQQQLQFLRQSLLNNPNLKAYFLNNPNLLNQLPNMSNRVTNNRIPFSIPNIQNQKNFILGPSNRPSHLPLHNIAKPQSQPNRQLMANPTHNNNLTPQQQFNNQINQMLFNKPGTTTQLNLTSLPFSHMLSNILANNQSLDQISPNNVLNVSSPKNYIKVEQAEVSRLLLGSNAKPSIRNEILSSSTTTQSSTVSHSSIGNEDPLNSIDSIHFPNELFIRTSINRTLNENQVLNTNLLNAFNKPHSINPTKEVEMHATKLFDKIDNLFDLTNATVISNNHHKNRFNPFNRTQQHLTGSFSSIISSSIEDPATQFNTDQLSNELPSTNGINPTTTWKSLDKFEIFNTNDNNLIKPTRTAWQGNPPDIITKPEEASTFDITVRNKMGANESRIGFLAENLRPTSVAGLHESSITPTLISSSKEPEVVYGRPANRPNNNLADSQLRPGVVNSVNPSTTQATITSVTLNNNNLQKVTPSLPSITQYDSIGRPLVYPVEMDLVKPQVATNSNNHIPSENVSILTESGSGSVYIDAQQKHFKLKPAQKTSTIPSMQIGSAMNVYGTGNNLDNRKPGSSLSSLNPINPFNSLNTTKNIDKSNRINQIRRPTFKQKPAIPLVRIDVCIINDESSCPTNEHCKIEAGISSCHCKPGFGRISQQGTCIPTTSLAMSLKLAKLYDNKLHFNKSLLDSESEFYQVLEFESIQEINSLFRNTTFKDGFLGVRVNKFYPVQTKTMLNATIILARNDTTKTKEFKNDVQKALIKRIEDKEKDKNNALSAGLTFDSVTSLRLDDINECADSTLNDCSRNAKCINELGTFSCVCKPGFEDRYAMAHAQALKTNQNKNLVMKIGRVCLSCSPAYCSGRGECSIVNGEKLCKCKGNFMGSRCDLDAEVLAVAFGGSLAALIIIIITILCLYIWNQKWKNEAQKMEAMSSNSGQTFNYVNKPANTTFRFGMEERGWNATAFEPTTLQNNASNYNYYVNPEQILISTSQHVYATPNREEVLHTPDQLLDDESNHHFYNTRRSKSRNCTLAYHQPAIYNETEFSTRKALYAPSLMGSRPKYLY